LIGREGYAANKALPASVVVALKTLTDKRLKIIKYTK